MRIVPALSWKVAGEPAEALDERLLPLLQAIAASGSLASAIQQCQLSYRAAWGLIKTEQRRLGAQLVLLERGRGAQLAAAGARLLAAQRAAEQRLARTLSALGVEIGPGDASERWPGPLRLTVAASHDPVLATLRDVLPAAAQLSLELSFMGSLPALERLRAGRADAAGFHVASDPRATADLAPFRRLLHRRRDRLIAFVAREQGFILPRGNPERVRSFADIARKRLRFVNRQRGSGTRLLIDRVLADEHVDPQSLVGYVNEEFTHAAVAATVASGAADAGFGVHAAAADYGLAFVPRVRERYYLAVRARALATPAVARLLEALEGPLLGRIVRRMPGYRRDGAGTILTVDRLGE